MKDRQAGNELASYDVMIERSIERLKGMRNLIMDLLDLTKPESGKKQREIKKFDLCEIMKVARDTIEPMAIQRNVKIYMENGEGCLVKADPREMEIILNNLISNAVKYNRENGEVRIHLKKQSGGIMLVVEDTGIGLSEEDQKILFQEFARVRNEKTQYIPGSGLGLSIVKKLTDMYSGTVEVESKPDQGSKFTVHLPILAQ
jgi:two-component system, sensor histidine kinase and response regulator